MEKSEFSRWLVSAPGAGKLLVSPEPDAAVVLLRESAAELGCTLVLRYWTNPPEHQALIAELVDSLAEAAGDLYPAWYGAADRDGPAIEVRAAGFPGVSLEWLSQALKRRKRGQRPVVERLPPALQVRQLVLALGGKKLIVACLAKELRAPLRALSLARAVEWLAGVTGCHCVVVLPPRWSSMPELDSLSYGAYKLRDEGPWDPLEEFVDTWVTVHPIIGHPHPKSRGEQILARRLATDPELKDLFEHNVPVTTAKQTRFLVDLLWRAGRLVVEVDGHYWHSTPRMFQSDRQRDFELLISDYLVLRLPHREVCEQTDNVLLKIRDLVRFRRFTGGVE